MEEEGGQPDRSPSPVAGPSGIRGLDKLAHPGNIEQGRNRGDLAKKKARILYTYGIIYCLCTGMCRAKQ